MFFDGALNEGILGTPSDLKSRAAANFSSVVNGMGSGSKLLQLVALFTYWVTDQSSPLGL